MAAPDRINQGHFYKEFVMDKKNRKNRIDRDPVKIALVSLAAVAVIAYVIVAIFYNSHFYSGFKIYGIECGGNTSEHVR